MMHSRKNIKLQDTSTQQSKPGSPVHGLVITRTMYPGSQCEQ